MRQGLATILFGVTIGTAATAAASVSVNPTRIVLAPGASSAVLSLRNDSAEEIRFQVTTFAWTNSPAGEMRLAETRDLVVFPTVFSIQPNAERRIRVAVPRQAGQQELTFRLLIRQMPARTAADPSTGVNLLTEFNVPVFVQPAERRATAVLDPVTVANGRVNLALHNRGSVHVLPEKIEITGLDARGATLWTRPLTPWYLLAGEQRSLALDLAGVPCPVRVAATVHFQQLSTPLREEAAVPAGACSR